MGAEPRPCVYTIISENMWSLKYYDMSLYPYICKCCKFPIVHPIIHVGDACANIEACLKREGLMKCKIVPSKGLYHPVLPYRYKKLLFCLCRTCPGTTLRANVNISAMSRDAWKARGS